MDAGQGLFERAKASAFLRVVKADLGAVKAVRPWYTGGRKEEWFLNKARWRLRLSAESKHTRAWRDVHVHRGCEVR